MGPTELSDDGHEQREHDPDRPCKIRSREIRCDRYAMCFHCRTNPVATFRQMYPRELTYGGNRSILFDANDEVDEEALSHCISLALTYHMRKSPSRRTTAASHKSRR